MLEYTQPNRLQYPPWVIIASTREIFTARVACSHHGAPADILRARRIGRAACGRSAPPATPLPSLCPRRPEAIRGLQDTPRGYRLAGRRTGLPAADRQGEQGGDAAARSLHSSAL